MVVGNAQLGDLGGRGHRTRVHLRFAGRRARSCAISTRWRTPRGGCCRRRTTSTTRFVVGYGLRGEVQRAFRLDLASGEVAGPRDHPGRRPQHRLVASTPTATWSAGPRTAAGATDAFVYAAGLGGMRELGDLVNPALGWKLAQANGINVHGNIVGWGYHHGARARLQDRDSRSVRERRSAPPPKPPTPDAPSASGDGSFPPG